MENWSLHENISNAVSQVSQNRRNNGLLLLFGNLLSCMCCSFFSVGAEEGS